MYTNLDKKYNFVSFFDPVNGFYMRTNVLTQDGKETDIEPFMASFPHLIDVGIMGHCVHGSSGLCAKSGVQCYQNGLHKQEPNMTLENFKKIVKECKGKCYQFALGGRGDPDQHENFEEILKICRKNKIVPNFTSSGLGFNKDIVKLCRRYCGAVAISEYNSDYTRKAIKMLVDAKVRTNIHYVLSNKSIDRAIELLKTNGFDEGIYAVIFLLHKPVGLGTEDNVLKFDDPRVKEFFSLVDNKTYPFRIGFDSCSIPGIINFTENIAHETIDTCEGGRFSMYITSDMKALPCSFDNQDLKWAFDISENSIQDAWDSEQFENFRSSFKNSCPSCPQKQVCLGGCPIRKQVVLCNRDCRNNGKSL